MQTVLQHIPSINNPFARPATILLCVVGIGGTADPQMTGIDLSVLMRCLENLFGTWLKMRSLDAVRDLWRIRHAIQ